MGTHAAKERLLQRLREIANEVSRREGALALLGLGSVGLERERLDQYSDLDFFVIVEPGYKARFIEDLDWLNAIRPVAYSFQNTVDGHKALYDDGVFCEFAVFEPEELQHIPFEQGQVEWSRDGFDPAGLVPPPRPAEFGAGDEAFLLGELLTNLYVGLARYARGERLSAFFFVQHHAVVRLISLLETWDEPADVTADDFSNERRFEQRLPQHAALISAVTPGYEDTLAAAERMLDFVETRVQPNAQISAEIRRYLTSLG